MPHEADTYPMNVFDEEAVLEDSLYRLFRLFSLAEAGLTLEELRAYESLVGKVAS